MNSEVIAGHATDLFWSLWTEMGISGMVQNHGWSAIDPEPLIVATPLVASGEPRLIEHAAGWCASNHGSVSTSRLDALANQSPEDVRAAFWSFSKALRPHGVKWPMGGQDVEPWGGRVPRYGAPLAVGRHSLFRFRMRALCGVGARADVLTELLARAASWTAATDLEHLGYSKRNISRILAELDAAGVTRMVRSGAALSFRLAAPGQLAQVIAPMPEAFPPWSLVFEHTILLLRLSRLRAEDGSVSQRVALGKLRERLNATATQLWLDPPPTTRGHRNPHSEILEWASVQIADLAAGQSTALRMVPVRAWYDAGTGAASIWLRDGAPDHARLAANLSNPAMVSAGAARIDGPVFHSEWTEYRLLFRPRLEADAARPKIEGMVYPLRVAWRSVAQDAPTDDRASSA